MTQADLADHERALRSWRRYIAEQVMGEAELEAFDIALMLVWAADNTPASVLTQLVGYLRDPATITEPRDLDFLRKIKAAALPA